MNSIQKQTENSQQDNNTMNKKQELYKQQRKNSQHEGNQKIILDHPITSEVEEDKTFSTPLTKEAIERNYKVFFFLFKLINKFFF